MPNVTVISTDGIPTDSKKNNEEGEAMLDIDTIDRLVLRPRSSFISLNLASRWTDCNPWCSY
jgi:hypothetical protein